MSQDIQWLKVQYFQSGTQYYLAARFLTFAHQIPVSGNLFHHAIEMYLKGHLCLTWSETNMKNLLKHKLVRIWEEFKKDVPDRSLTKFDKTIAGLHRFENIRYPEEVFKKGMHAVISFEKPPPQPPSSPRRKEPKYEVIISDVDELVAVIFEKANANPSIYTGHLPDEARAYLTSSNKVNIWEK